MSIHRGILAVGEIKDGQEVSFGKTSPDGISLSVDLTEYDVESGQDQLPVDIHVTSANAEFSGTLIFSSMENFARVLGLPDDAVAEELDGSSVLAIANTALGSKQASSYYFSTPGKVGPRKIVFQRAKLLPNGEISFGREGEVQLPFKVRALATLDETAPITITDPAA